LSASPSKAEINRELAALRRAYRLCLKAKKIDDAPSFDMLKESNARQGFFAREEFEAIVEHLTPEVAAAVRLGYITGWRINSEVLPLTWKQVDFHARTVRLEPNTTKNDDGRVFTFTGELESLLRAQRAYTEAVQKQTGTIIPQLFHCAGKPVKNYYAQWLSACLKVGLATRDPKTKRIKTTRIPHDFRRTAVRNLVNAGVPEKVAMTMTGHKTRAVFDRYHIVSPRRHRTGRSPPRQAPPGRAGRAPFGHRGHRRPGGDRDSS
jgi:integrase